MPRIPIYKRQLMLDFLNDGLNMAEIARRLKIVPNSVKLIKKKFANKKTLFDLPKSGRKLILSQRSKIDLVINSKFHPFMTAGELRISHNLDNKVSVDTVKRVLRKAKLWGRIAAAKPKLTPLQKNCLE